MLSTWSGTHTLLLRSHDGASPVVILLCLAASFLKTRRAAEALAILTLLSAQLILAMFDVSLAILPSTPPVQELRPRCYQLEHSVELAVQGRVSTPEGVLKTALNDKPSGQLVLF